MGIGKAAAKIVAVPVDVAGAGVNAAGDATTAVVVGTKSAVNGLLEGASGAGVKVVRGAQTAATGVTSAAKKFLVRSGTSLNGALGMRGGRRSTRKNKNRSNKNRSNKNRSNKNRSNKNRKNKNRSNKNRNRH